ncbi:TadE/TadG family type IV pilus assembly protein [Streptomyces sp. NPDC047023]|uniref:TadE/TadG family type IV pilus assembly protein n=1 Tax=Streptomyces sp. NPDC047023 TaxID=3155139 RepID=UPI00340F2A80
MERPIRLRGALRALPGRASRDRRRAPCDGRPHDRDRGPHDRDRGQAALEYLGFLPFLLLVALAGIQLGWAGYVVQQAETAARTAARVEAREPGAGAAAGRAAIKESLRSGAEIDVSTYGGAVTATVRLSIRSIVPGVGDGSALRSATMPEDDPEGPRP